ncbi:methylenetetrahydrofolate reductase [Amycolatopsis nalaikhensis]|uniref:Methylenetetrahydrofolate reductase n=1 Tax=Amycolatopsis nalaikhensis TaxID=715472 RepID=A0ABY8XKX2_9PSEU|nr:methylenetetrahydrofolate reductase [Amycolatopsis sp. 2-2]WIV56243.1 methylenetetrahydrofolate reductase [Amycolatopsis sp. 2-2]
MDSFPYPGQTSVALRIGELVAAAACEVIPLKGADQKVSGVPRATPLTITCSPKFGLDRTLEHVASAVAQGFRVVPHLAARMVDDEQALRRFVTRVTDLGVDELFVVGGDGEAPVGKFTSAGEVLESLTHFEHGLRRIGVGCYPEGHPKIDDADLIETLLRKQESADYMVSQLCFDAAALTRWIDDVRAAGVRLPLRIGLAAPIKTARLLELSMKIGVGQSVRYLRKQHGMLRGLVLGRSYAPERLLTALGKYLTDAVAGIEGLHVFTFNQLDVTVDWLTAGGAR